ncbi:MAG: ribosome small subunit-dependent GTPase A [candidate division Zixibacteria bacterium RBG_16_53_22]|nr:MAG: ribosome small subunit-dependent GTPase A [candidate division Zixibacteria bacterium RBG_16_53_22]
MTETIANNIARVVGKYGPRVEIQTADGVISAVVRGRLKYGGSEHQDTAQRTIVAVGDYVEFAKKSGHTATINRILERNKVISRPAVGKEGIVQVVVSNVDRIVIVTSTTDPDFKAGVVDRLLIIAFKEEIKPVIVLNKIDLADPEAYRQYTDAWMRIGCDILFTSARTGEHIDEFGRLLSNGTCVVVGHSGVGKSSLLNKLSPGLQIKIGDISSYSGKGKHTTSRVNLFRLFPQGWVADTPGLKDLGLVGVTRKNLHNYYPEFAPFESGCQFTDCVHVDEPSCAVKDAVDKPDCSISRFRYQNYLSIYHSLGK